MTTTDIKDYAVQCFKDEAQAILDLIPMLDYNFSQAVRLIYNCPGKVIVTGVGKSGHVGEKIASTLASLGTPSFFLHPLDAYHGDLGMVAEGDVVLAISYSGYTDELLRFLPLLIERNISIIGMSGNQDSLLAKYSACHLNIKVDHEADPLNLAPTSSTTTCMAMGDALACALVHLRHFKAKDFAQNHPGGTLGKRLLSRASDYMLCDNLPVVDGHAKMDDVIAIVSKGKLGLALIIDDDQKLQGIITDGDLRRAMQKYHKKLFDLTATDIMTSKPKTIHPDANHSEVDKMMRQYNIHALIVTDSNERVVGIIDSFHVIS